MTGTPSGGRAGEPKRADARRLKREARADLFFGMYLALGPNRSIHRLAEMAIAAGVPTAPGTLMGYSADFRWQERLREFEATRASALGALSLGNAIADDMAHAALGRRLRSLAEISIDARIRSALPIADGPPVDLGFSGAELARMAREAVNIERLASGRATEIREIIVPFYDLIVRDIGDIWVQSLNAALGVFASLAPAETIEAARYAAQAVFGPQADRVLSRHLESVGIDVALLGASGQEADSGDDE